MRPAVILRWSAGLLTLTLGLTALAAHPATALPPTLNQIQQAIQNQNLDWDAASNSVWLKTWAEKDSLLGLLESKDLIPMESPCRLPDGFFKDLPDSFDWRNKGGKNYIGSVKDQGHCGSCWAFAGCGVVEALRKINGYSPCGVENLSEQFLVSCNVGVGQNLGCQGGYPDRTANFLQNTGTPDEACYPYKAKTLPCNLRCDDWQSRVRKISSWSYVRNGGSPTSQSVDSIRSAVYVSPQWITMYVYEDFYAYDGGVYEYATGDKQGGHAITLVGYNDVDSCFICKNSWGTDWGEKGYFRIGYSQVAGDVDFGKWTIAYDMDPEEDESVDDCHRYSVQNNFPYDWIPGSHLTMISADDEVVLVTPTFSVKYFCAQMQGPIGVSSNGWLGMHEFKRDDPWPDHYPIPSPEGPASMIAPLWTDLNPSLGGSVWTGDTGDGRFVVEYRHVIRKDTGDPETFEVVFFDPQVYPTMTGDAMILFQYQQHYPWNEYHTVGIENHEQTCGVQMCCDGAGEPIEPGMAILFTPVPYGDEHPAEAPWGLFLEVEEPWVNIYWDNPTHNSEGFELPFIDAVMLERDEVVIAELHGEPGEAMSYADRDPGPGPHTYAVYVRVGTQAGARAEEPITVPSRTAHATHDVGNVLFTVTDQGICGYTDAGQTEGIGFTYGSVIHSLVFIGSFWAGTDSLYALNRDYDNTDPYSDWRYRSSFGGRHRVPPDQEFRAAYDDAGHPYARGLRVEQSSRAWADPPYDDFVIVEYTLHNEGAETISGLYAGQFMDWDVSLSAPWTDQGATDPDERLVYMWHDETFPYVGIALLDTLPPHVVPAANLTLIHNPTYVYPQGCITDADRALFLSGGDPDHSVAASWQPDDWCAMASGGPYTLIPGDSVGIAFALLAGDDENDLRANVAAALIAYGWGASGVAETEASDWRLQLGTANPNPFARGTTIRYTLPRHERVRLAIFDATGRLVRTLREGGEDPGRHVVHWDARGPAGRPLPCGVYFCRLDAGGTRLHRQLVIVR
ncbi:MAG: hypothetical protein KAY32_12695 [Candidatus Eisenbacteria sp.]|nr:hypothetical protein [Candidatus Eisenbacteria bacterium]